MNHECEIGKGHNRDKGMCYKTWYNFMKVCV